MGDKTERYGMTTVKIGLRERHKCDLPKYDLTMGVEEVRRCLECHKVWLFDPLLSVWVEAEWNGFRWDEKGYDNSGDD